MVMNKSTKTLRMSSPTAEDVSWPELHRVRRAIVVVDVVESVRLMQAYEADVIDRWRRFVAEVRTAVLPRHGGRMVKSLGDGMLLDFESVPPACAAAFDIVHRIRAHNIGRAADSAICLRVGANVADIVVDELDIYGPGVNLAARVATLAGPNEVVATVPFCDELVAGVDAELEDLGDCYVKHLDDAVHCFRLTVPAAAGQLVAPSTSPVPRAEKPQVAPRLAVMPLTGFGLPPSDTAAGHLIADNLISRLSAGDALRIISRLSTAALVDRALTVPEIAARLGAQYVVSGSIVQRGAGRWRIGIELADGVDGAALWSCSTDLDSHEALLPDDDYSADAAAHLLEAIAAHQLRRLQTQPLPSLQSYALQLAGLTLIHRASRDDFERGRGVLESLVERHPRAPVPRAWLAKWWVLRTTRGMAGHPYEEAGHALGHIRAALQADPDCALALAMQGFVECHMLRDLDAAEASLDKAMAINPSEPLAWLYLSVVHGFRGQGELAFRAAETATSLSPLDPQRHYFDALAASAAITAGHLARGIDLADRALKANRNHLPTLRALTVAQAESGDLDAARFTAQRVLQLTPDFTIRSYVSGAPRGSETTRQRFAAAFSRAGLPLG